MKLLEEKILSEGVVKSNEILMVDRFLNHQIDVNLLNELGKEFAKIFGGSGITKILTIEASGIGIACITAQYFGVPVVFAKKSKSSNQSKELIHSSVYSFTHNVTYDVTVDARYITKSDRILVIDDFLAEGNAISGLVDIINKSGAEFIGAGIVIEKGFQGGGDSLRAKGYRIESLAIIESMSVDGNISFR